MSGNLKEFQYLAPGFVIPDWIKRGEDDEDDGVVNENENNENDTDTENMDIEDNDEEAINITSVDGSDVDNENLDYDNNEDVYYDLDDDDLDDDDDDDDEILQEKPRSPQITCLDVNPSLENLKGMYDLIYFACVTDKYLMKENEHRLITGTMELSLDRKESLDSSSSSGSSDNLVGTISIPKEIKEKLVFINGIEDDDIKIKYYHDGHKVSVTNVDEVLFDDGYPVENVGKMRIVAKNHFIQYCPHTSHCPRKLIDYANSVCLRTMNEVTSFYRSHYTKDDTEDDKELLWLSHHMNIPTAVSCMVNKYLGCNNPFQYKPVRQTLLRRHLKLPGHIVSIVNSFLPPVSQKPPICFFFVEGDIFIDIKWTGTGDGIGAEFMTTFVARRRPVLQQN